MNPFRNLIRRVGTLPPEPLPDPAEIDRHSLPPVASEHQSADARFVILVTLNHDGLYRAHQFSWFTHADDDTWAAFWSQHALGIITDQYAVVMAEVDHRLLAYEKSLSNSYSNGGAEQGETLQPPLAALSATSPAT